MKLGRALVDRKIVLIVVDVTKGAAWLASDVFPEYDLKDSADMVALIHKVKEFDRELPLGAGIPLAEITLQTPLANPPHNIMCVGKNYTSHAMEFARSGFDSSASQSAIPECPIIFTKPSTSLAGPDDDIPMWPGLDESMDYEAELGVIIGKEGRAIAKADALDHIFGYVVINDVTARDLQKNHKQWFLGKAIDGFCPMGPWITTRDEVDLRTASIRCSVNGELRQDAAFTNLIFDVPTIIETISRSLTLHPGDIIATGTPEGVGIGFNPPRFLRDGDLVECEIDGIGSIRNRVRRMTVLDGRAKASAEAVLR